MFRFILALVIIASAVVITQKLGLIERLSTQAPKVKTSSVATATAPAAKPASRDITKSEVYRWVDKHGNVHFSDKAIPDSNEKSMQKIIVSHQATQFVAPPKLKPLPSIQHSRQSSGQPSRSKRCQQLKTEIDKRERKLRRWNKSTSLDPKLEQKRWQKIKTC
jgi:hypothetical protein